MKKSPTPRQRVLSALEVLLLAGGDYEIREPDGFLCADLYAPRGFVWLANDLPTLSTVGTGPRVSDWRFLWSQLEKGMRGVV